MELTTGFCRQIFFRNKKAVAKQLECFFEPVFSTLLLRVFVKYKL